MVCGQGCDGAASERKRQLAVGRQLCAGKLASVLIKTFKWKIQKEA